MPQNIKRDIDFDSIKLENTSFVEKNLKKKVTDLLFTANFAGEKGYIFLLVEHQSTVDHWMSFRLLCYISAIWQRHIDDNPHLKHLPLVYPLIFYNGRDKYTASKDLWGLFKEPLKAKEFLTEPFNVINVQEIKDEEFKEYPWAGTFELFMKYAYLRDIIEVWKKSVPLLKELRFASIHQKEDYIFAFLWYTISKIEKSAEKDEIIEIINNTLDVEGDKIMPSLAKQWEQQGIQKGMKKGMQQGEKQKAIAIAMALLNEKQSPDFVAKITGLSLAEVNSLK